MSVLMNFTAAPADRLFRGHECTEVGSGEPMCFSAPTPEDLDASLTQTARREQAAAWLFDEIERHGYSPDLERKAEQLYEASGPMEAPDQPDTFAEKRAETERLVRSAEALVEQFERDGPSPEVEAAVERLCDRQDET